MNFRKVFILSGYVLFVLFSFSAGEMVAQVKVDDEPIFLKIDTAICFNPLTQGTVLSIMGQIDTKSYKLIQRTFYLPDNIKNETVFDTVVIFDVKTFEKHMEITQNTFTRDFSNNHSWGKVRKVNLEPGDDVVERAEDYFEKNNTDKVILFNSDQLMICVQGSPDAKAKRKKGKGLEYEYVEGILIGKSKS